MAAIEPNDGQWEFAYNLFELLQESETPKLIIAQALAAREASQVEMRERLLSLEIKWRKRMTSPNTTFERDCIREMLIEYRAALQTKEGGT